jgi:hypothetical protein
MMTNTELCRQRLLDRLGVDTHEPKWKSTDRMFAEIAEKKAVLDEIVKLAKDRLVMGSIRYGRNTNYDWDSIRSKMGTKWKTYMETGNLEMLVDMVNYCAIEFKNRTHPDSHFNALDDEAHG